jgi:FKBP-type peptidyl-prolyl cis-trans isomerase FklB
MACEKKSDTASYDTTPESNARFLEDYAKRPGVTKLPDGLMYRVIKAGNGPQVQKPNDVVTVFYKGALIDGKVFDQTKPEEPAQFPSGALIPGWVEALKLMKTGDTWELAIPSELGYGADGAGDSIPPNQTLVFTMSLVKVEYAP